MADAADCFGWTKKTIAEVPSRENVTRYSDEIVYSVALVLHVSVFLCWVGGHFSDTVCAL